MVKLIWATCAGLAIAAIVIPAFLMAGGVLIMLYVSALFINDDGAL